MDSVLRFVVLFAFLTVSTASVRPKEDTAHWRQINEQTLAKTLKRTFNQGRAKNIIFCLGDGMSLGTINAMRQFKAEVEGRPGTMDNLFFENFPTASLLKAYTTDESIGDSSSTASAYMTGVRTKTYMINMDDNVNQGECDAYKKEFAPRPITKTAKKSGKSVGMVTTSRITHATPATTYANSVDRWWESDSEVPKQHRGKCIDIAQQFVERGDHLDVMLGGGRGRFMPQEEQDPENTDMTGRRLDHRNLIKEWILLRQRHGMNCSYVYDQAKFDTVDARSTDCLLGLFAHDHMRFEAERSRDEAGEPSLVDMTEKAIRILSKNDKGFFMVLEGARIDHGHHSGRAKYAITDGLEFEKAIRKAVEMTDEKETLVIVLADHSHSMLVTGRKKRDKPLFGLGDKLGKDGMPYTSILYATGPGYDHSFPTGRQNLTDVDTHDFDYRQQAAVPTSIAMHAGDDVSVYAQGPWSHLIHGLTEQTFIHEVMKFASCMDQYEGKEHCSERMYSLPVNDKGSHGERPSLNIMTYLLVAILLIYNVFN